MRPVEGHVLLVGKQPFVISHMLLTQGSGEAQTVLSGVWIHPFVESQVSIVQSIPSSQWAGIEEQVPAEQEPTLQASPVEQFIGTYKQTPLVQESVVQALLSLQVSVKTHCPLLHDEV